MPGSAGDYIGRAERNTAFNFCQWRTGRTATGPHRRRRDFSAFSTQQQSADDLDNQREAFNSHKRCGNIENFSSRGSPAQFPAFNTDRPSTLAYHTSRDTPFLFSARGGDSRTGREPE